MTTREYIEKFLDANFVEDSRVVVPPDISGYFNFTLELIKMHSTTDPDTTRIQQLETRIQQLEGDFHLHQATRKR